MLRDLQDASAMPQKVPLLSMLVLILNNLPAMG
jgi:hypothetical protein